MGIATAKKTDIITFVGRIGRLKKRAVADSTEAGSLAQLAEHLTLNQRVIGSIPIRSTM